MDKEQRYDLIERYLRGELSGSELSDFEQQILSDPFLKQELKLHREIHDSIGNEDIAGFRELLNQSENDYFSAELSEKRSIWQEYRWLAASVILLISVGVLFFFVVNKPEPDALYTAYYQPYEVPGNFRSDSSPVINQVFREAMQNYNSKKYAEAIPLLSRVISSKPDHFMAVFVRGVSYLSIGKTNLAEADFKRVIADRQNMFVEQSTWYLALTYLKENKTEAAKKELKKIEQNPQAAKLLDELR